MTKRPDKDVQPLPVSDDERDAHFLELANDAWAEFVMNGQPAALAEYLRLGGEVDERVRQILVDLLKDDPRGNPGGGKPFRDWKTFVSVNEMLIADKFQRALGASDDAGRRKPLSKRQALIRYSEMTQLELRAVEKQYQRGADISKEFQ